MKKLFALCLFCFLSTLLGGDKPNVIIIFTDDHGYADLGCQGSLDDVKTPFIDTMAAEGVRCTSGYATAPQCCPSRAGIISGQYQQKFGLDSNGKGSLPWSLNTIPERIRSAGYVTGMVGKWHLAGNGLVGSNGEYAPGYEAQAKEAAKNPLSKQERKTAKKSNPSIAGDVHNHGFMEYLNGPMNNYLATHDIRGKAFQKTPRKYTEKGFRIDNQTEWSVNFIKRNVQKKKPFFLYLAYFAPHVPLDASEKYLSRFSEDMPKRRRTALAMISAMDDGVGRIRKTLKDLGQLENTLIFFISDNGAPLKIKKEDKPGGGPGWDGSLNTPLNGEKGMLSEGGVRVPYIVSWPGTIPGNQVYDRPVISLDASFTAAKVAGCKDFKDLDGVDLLPFLRDGKKEDPHEALYFRWSSQAAIRQGDWKLLTYNGTSKQYLFDLSKDKEEKVNLFKSNPERAKALQEKLLKWANKMHTKGFDEKGSKAATSYYDFYMPK